MGYSEKAMTTTTVQGSISTPYLAPDDSERKCQPTQQLREDLLVFPTTTNKEDSDSPGVVVLEEKVEKDSPDHDQHDYSDESSKEYHEFYLQRDGMEFFLPILFEDGMDYVECEYYYASIQQQQSGNNSSSKKRSSPLQRGILPPISSKLALQQQQETQGKLLCSCIRSGNNKRLRSAPSEEDPTFSDRTAVRRCSFSGMPQLSSQAIPTLTRSQSWQHLSDLSRHRHHNHRGVGFEKHVRVVTIYPATDYPDDMRRSLWMSREEMTHNMRRATRQREKHERQRLPSQEEK
jgi:hypothetical protein